MYKYKIYGINFESDIELPECESIDDTDEAEVLIRLSDLSYILEDINHIIDSGLAKRGPNGELPTRYVKWENGILFAYVIGVGCFKVSGANMIEYHPTSPAEGALFHQWMLAFAITIILIQRYEIVLHGAGLLVPDTDNAIVVCGESGAGKSTISDALLNKGLLFVSDDSVRLSMIDGEAKVIGSYMQRRLCTDVVDKGDYDKSELSLYEGETVKKYMKIMKGQYYGDVPHKLKDIFVLYKYGGSEVKISEVTGADKVKEIMSQLYKVSVYAGLDNKTAIYMKAISIASNTRVYRVYRPNEGMTVDEITNAIYNVALE